MSDIVVKKALFTEFYESTKLLVKETRKVKDLRDQCIDLEGQFKRILSEQAIDTEVTIGHEYVARYIQVILSALNSDSPVKLIDHLCKILVKVYNDTTIMTQISSREVNQAKQYKSVTQLLLYLIGQMVDQMQVKFYQNAVDLLRQFVLHSNDIHFEDMKTLTSILFKIGMSNTQHQVSARRIIVQNIQVLGQKYFASVYVPIDQESLPRPQNYDSIELEIVYQNDYKSFLIVIIEHLTLLNQYLNQIITLDFFNKQFSYFDLLQPGQIEKFSLMINENIFWLLKLIPLNAIKETNLKSLFEKLYYEMLNYVLLTNHYILQEYFLINIETYLRIFLNTISKQFLFEHFNNFIIRILNCHEIPYYQLKAAILAHLIRMVCQDGSNFQLELQRSKDLQEFTKNYTLVDLVNLKNCTETQQQEYFELIQRLYMPPGVILHYLYTNFDAQFTQPNLVSMLFQSLATQHNNIEHLLKSNKQTYQSFILDKEITLHRTYHRVVSFFIKHILQQFQSNERFASQLNKLSHSCGILDCNSAATLNMEFEGDMKNITYKVTNYIGMVVQTIARLYGDLFDSYLIFQYNHEDNQFIPRYGFMEENICELEKILQQKQLMEIGFDKFNEAGSNPMRAIEHFEQIGYIQPLVQCAPGQKASLNEELQGYYEQLQSQPPEPPQDPDKPRRRIRRTFEEEYAFTMQQISGYLVEYENQQEHFEQLIKFYLEYTKKSDYSVGLGKQGFGEIIGGSKIENKAALYYYTKYFRDTYLEQGASSGKTTFVQALRAFLSYFKLPGEGQVIDRIMSFFSKAYADYAGMDHRTIHGLSFAVIMLNTDLHNQSIREARMTRDIFKANTKKIDAAGQLTDELLGTIYDEILTKPFTLGEIEAIKKYFMITTKYINIEEKKDSAQEATQSQDKTLEEDKETEMIKQMSPNQRFSKALLEWVHYGSTYYNKDSSDAILELQDVKYGFSYQLFTQMFKQLDKLDCVKLLLRNVHAKERMSNVQLCLKMTLLVILSKRLGLSAIAHKYVSQYIQTSQFLTYPIIQFAKFDLSKVYDQIVNTTTIEQPKGVTATDPRSINDQSLELVVYLMEVMQQKLQPQKFYTKCYSGELQIEKIWDLLIEVASRVQYYQTLINNMISQQNRSLLSKGGPGSAKTNQNLDYSKLLALDVGQTFQLTEIRQELQMNLINIAIKFYNHNIFDIVNYLPVALSQPGFDEYEHVINALSRVSQVELCVYIQQSYCLYSNTLLTQIFTNLIENNIKLFTTCYSQTFNHYEKILTSRVPEIPERGFESVAQIIGTFLSKQIRLNHSTTPEQQDTSQQIWMTIFMPLNLCMLSSSMKLIWVVLEKIFGYLQYIEFNQANYEQMLKLVFNEQPVDDNVQMEEFVTVYSRCFKRFVLPKVTISLIISIVQQAIDKLITSGNQQLAKADQTLSLDARKKNLKTDIIEPMSLAKKIAQYLSGIVVLYTYVIRQQCNQFELNSNGMNLITTYLNLLNHLRNQLLFDSISQEIQVHMFKFIRIQLKLILKCTQFTNFDNEQQLLISISNTIGELIENACSDDRTTLRDDAQEQTRKLLSEIIHNKAGRPQIQLIYTNLLTNKFLDKFENWDANLVFQCDNLSEGRFICKGCQHYRLHCLTELFVDELFIETDEHSLAVQRMVFTRYLQSICQHDNTSIMNLLVFIIKRLVELQQSAFLLSQFAEVFEQRESLIKIAPNYIRVLTQFLVDGQGCDLSNKILVFCSECHQELVGKEQHMLNKLYVNILQIFGKEQPDDDREVIDSVIRLISGFLTTNYANSELTNFTLNFINQMRQELFAQHFKVALYDSILMLNITGDENVRRNVYEVLRQRYRPCTTEDVPQTALNQNNCAMDKPSEVPSGAVVEDSVGVESVYEQQTTTCSIQNFLVDERRAAGDTNEIEIQEKSTSSTGSVVDDRDARDDKEASYQNE